MITVRNTVVYPWWYLSMQRHRRSSGVINDKPAAASKYRACTCDDSRETAAPHYELLRKLESRGRAGRRATSTCASDCSLCSHIRRATRMHASRAVDIRRGNTSEAAGGASTTQSLVVLRIRAIRGVPD